MQVMGTLNETMGTAVNSIVRVNPESTAIPKPSAIEPRTPNAFRWVYFHNWQLNLFILIYKLSEVLILALKIVIWKAYWNGKWR